MRCLLTFSLLVIFNFQLVSRDSTRYMSLYGGLHFAGNTGLFSFNAGKKFFKDNLTLGIGYGYLPRAINDAEVHSILFKASYCFSKGLLLKKAQWYGGVTTIYSITKNTFINLPSYYSEDYYAPNAIHVAPHIGLRMPFMIYKPLWADKVSIHTELGTLDSYLWYFIINKKVRFWDICNLSAGIYYDF